ncbi:Endo-1,4-beta-xylanase A precursor [compost metagenome]
MRIFRLVAAFLATSLLVVILPWVARADVSNSDADLISYFQGAGTLSPAFSPEITEYKVDMRSSDSSYYAAATLSNGDATLAYSMNGSPWTSIGNYVSTGYLATQRGNNTFQFKVTSSDNSTSKIYTVQVYYPYPNDANLRDLSVSPGGISPAFNPLTTAYTLNVPNATSSLDVNAVSDDPAASIHINGNSAVSGVVSSVPLNVGSNMVEVEVQSQDASVSKAYYLTVTRALPSTNADLSALSVQGHSLTPAFQSAVTAYALQDAGYDTGTIAVTPTASDSTAAISIKNSQGGYDPITSGSLSAPLGLSPGDNTIVIKVTAQDGITEKLYSLSVHRKSNNALLSQLTASPGGLKESFSSGVFTYALANITTDSLTVTPTLADPKGLIQISVNNGTYTPVSNGQGAVVPLTAGTHTIQVMVFAEDTGYSNVYNLTVKRVQDSTLSPVSGTFDKNASNTAAGHYRDVTTALSLNGNLLSGLKLGSAALDNAAYTLSGSTLTLHKEFLSTLAAGEHEFELVMDAGSHPLFTVAVKDTTPPVLAAPAAGDAAVTLTWTPVSGATGYKVFASTVPGMYGTALATLGAAADSYSAAGLTNGTTYYFVVKAVNGGGDSAASAEVSATPQVSAPGAPVLQTAVPGNGTVSLNWEPAAGASGYAIYQSTVPGNYGQPAGTVAGSVYSYHATGLTNGTTYYFAVKAANPGGDSALSNEVSATPRTVPAAPVILSTTAGDGLVTITFAAPADNGGSSVTSYEITASPGGSVTTGSASPVTVTGLVNGTAYTFTVKAINGAGMSPGSAPSNAVTPMAPASGAGDPTEPVPTVRPSVPVAPVENTVGEVLTYVNGKIENLSTLSSVLTANRRHSTVTLDQAKVEGILAGQQPGAEISIEFNNRPDVQTVELNGLLLQHLQQKQAAISVHTGKVTYSIPLQLIRWDTVAGQLGTNASAADVRIQIEIAAPDASLAGTAQTAAAEGSFTFLAEPIDFSVKIVSGGQTTSLSGFSAYVKQIFSLPAGTDTSRATGIVIEPDGTVRHVPTRFVLQDDGYAAIISSLTNSTYAIVSHPVEFKDMAGHWAKNAVNDLGARLVVSGSGNGFFLPGREMTRAEFAAVLVRGLGLQAAGSTTPFTDVSSSDWYSSAVQTASRYQLITGFEDGSFRPEDSITREQAMTMMAQAMRLTGLSAGNTGSGAAELLRGFTDADEASAWAAGSIAASLQAGLISGRSGTQLAPQSPVTRAEVAVMLQRLLQKSGLIQEN